MYLSDLNILQVRNLQDVRLQLHTGANLFYGENGSGKTSILEAVFLLGRGRSFRHRDLRTVINRDAEDLVVSGLLHSEQGARHRLGVQRNRAGEFKARRDGEPLQSAGELVEALPVQLIEPHSFSLLEGGPLQRRQFLDWGVFHVEHNYRSAWRGYQKALKQRNELLRHDRITPDLLAAWDKEIAPLGEAISQYRSEYLSALTLHVSKLMARFDRVGELALSYQQGWEAEKPLATVLQESRRRDQATGKTNYGPHRADIRISIDGVAAAQILSRGQTKLLVYALKLAQAQYFFESSGERCLFLLDDLPAELDQQHRELVVSCLEELGGQYLVTGVARGDFDSLVGQVENKMFHVEQGGVSPEKSA